MRDFIGNSSAAVSTAATKATNRGTSSLQPAVPADDGDNTAAVVTLGSGDRTLLRFVTIPVPVIMEANGSRAEETELWRDRSSPNSNGPLSNGLCPLCRTSASLGKHPTKEVLLCPPPGTSASLSGKRAYQVSFSFCAALFTPWESCWK